MFTHQGRRRTWKHNLQIASLLSFVAGTVNVAGFLAVGALTTNVTGHFAFFADEVLRLDLWQAFVYFLYILSFFLGSFSSSFLAELVSRKNADYVYIVPTSIESLILALAAFFGKDLMLYNPNWLACNLLFAMGLQNSLVTRISNAVVRTTHLTGLFTDLGIELSQLFFYREQESRQRLFSSIRLRFAIIGFFFLGGIAGGVLYSRVGIVSLFSAALLLALGIIYDNFKLKLILIKRRYRHHGKPTKNL